MLPYLEPLVVVLKQQANAAEAKPMKDYMKGRFPFLGVKRPLRSALLNDFLSDNGKPDPKEIPTLLIQLWELPEREYQYLALEFLKKGWQYLTDADIELMEWLITEKSWWDTVDMLSQHGVSNLLYRYPKLIDSHPPKWLQSDNIWLQRTAILYQLKWKKETDSDKLFYYCSCLAHSNEFFIRKAIGWALREYSKSDADAVLDFISQNKLSPLSEREALKQIKARG